MAFFLMVQMVACVPAITSKFNDQTRTRNKKKRRIKNVPTVSEDKFLEATTKYICLYYLDQNFFMRD